MLLRDDGGGPSIIEIALTTNAAAMLSGSVE
jgi:hypothetical protein